MARKGRLQARVGAVAALVLVLGTAIAADRNGGYTEVLTVHAGLMVLGAILLARLPRFPDWSAARA